MRFLRVGDQIPSKTWAALSEQMALEPSIMSSRATPDGLRGAFEEGCAILLWDNDGAAGFIAAWPAPEGRREIGAAWVAPPLRGRGLGIRLVAEIVRLVGGTDPSRVFAITTNQRFVAAARHSGMQTHGTWDDPVPWACTCEPCDAVSEEEKPRCPKRNATCLLLIFPGAT